MVSAGNLTTKGFQGQFVELASFSAGDGSVNSSRFIRACRRRSSQSSHAWSFLLRSSRILSTILLANTITISHVAKLRIATATAALMPCPMAVMVSGSESLSARTTSYHAVQLTTHKAIATEAKRYGFTVSKQRFAFYILVRSQATAKLSDTLPYKCPAKHKNLAALETVGNTRIQRP